MENQRILYRQEDFPVLQKRVFETAEAAKNSSTGNILLVENLDTGLIYNAAFDANLIVYDQNYDNEQSHSRVFQKHLEQVATMALLHGSTGRILPILLNLSYFDRYRHTLGCHNVNSSYF